MMYRTPYLAVYDQLPLPHKYKLPDFTKFSGQGEVSIVEHINRFIMQCGEVLVFCNATNKIRKRTDTTVAFTQEYSRVSYPLGNVSTLPTGSSYPRTHTSVGG